jgi:hypothetical protein
MRRLKPFRLLLMLVLFFSVVCGEAIESSKLCDDVSNDFVEAAFEQVSRGAVNTMEQRVVQPGASIVAKAFPCRPVIPALEVVPLCRSGLLRLLSVQRK